MEKKFDCCVSLSRAHPVDYQCSHLKINQVALLSQRTVAINRTHQYKVADPTGCQVLHVYNSFFSFLLLV